MSENYLKKAIEFAKEAHGNQRYGDKPYVYHLLKVAKVAKRYGGSEFQIICSFLHDVLEDTPVTFDQLSKAFGRAATVIDLVSNRASKEETFKRIRSSKDAVFVKLCDRIANVEEGAKNSKYRKEYPLFKSILYRKGEFESMWEYLDKLLK